MLRLLFFISVMAALSLFVVSRFFAHSPWHGIHGIWLFVTTLIIILFQILAFKSNLLIPRKYQRRKWFGPLVAVISWVSYTCIGIYYCMILYVIAADIVFIIWGLLSPKASIAHMHHVIFDGIIFVTVTTCLLGFYQALASPKIVRVDIPIRNLPPEFDKFRIVQISDLHVDALTGRRYVDRVVRLANQLDGDIAALTGDFADGRVSVLRRDLELLKNIKAPMYFIPGNHEYYWRPKEWLEFYEQMGAHVLLNRHEIIRRGKAELVIAGVEDYSQRRKFNPEKALEGAPQDATKILLAHQPSGYDRAKAAGADLQLSGHTHGGQFFPWNFVVRFFHRYFVGLHQHDGMWIYISSGTGFWGTPLRTFNPPEITLITLHTQK